MAAPNANGPRRRVRQCWICLEEVEPAYEERGWLDRVRNRPPRRSYFSEGLGRLINPCLCRGTIKYVHEGCLRQWMITNPDVFQCARCHYQYQVQRMTWARGIRNPTIAVGLTFLIFCTTVFFLGFIADPVFGLWIDPVGAISDILTRGRIRPDDDLGDVDDFSDIPNFAWILHFLKGFFTLGLLGFVKFFYAVSPWQWWNIRTSGILGGGGRRRAAAGRRMENINLVLVLIGVLTFIYTVWSGVQEWIWKVLDRASLRILNVQNDNDADSDVEVN
ncbi:hypothetical protein F5B19DRAFT_450258 [Rostrohypoxylon terebratum]|nr:hypothetical protein F5B19DRAFT_450258 [Rostrohypoxylon terebratum]